MAECERVIVIFRTALKGKCDQTRQKGETNKKGFLRVCRLEEVGLVKKRPAFPLVQGPDLSIAMAAATLSSTLLLLLAGFGRAVDLCPQADSIDYVASQQWVFNKFN
jgi:hypothetical protein